MITLKLQNFRSHRDFSARITNGVNIITGVNGSGKTSLLEALYLSLTGKSWRSNFNEIIRRNDDLTADWWRVDLTDNDNRLDRTVKFNQGDKSFIINGREWKRLPMANKLPVVLFEPNDIQLLYGSPSRRRDFFDRFIAQLVPDYQTTLNKFNRVLRQRNILLKQAASSDEILVWNIQFSSLSERIAHQRQLMVSQIVKRLNEKYQIISGRTDRISLKYLPGGPLESAAILDILNNSNLDIVTPVGVQKDDYKFSFNGRDAKTNASRGENRTILFAVLAVITDIIRATKGRTFVLLDDIDSELDQIHRDNLYSTDSFQIDTIATTLEYDDNKCHHIELG